MNKTKKTYIAPETSVLKYTFNDVMKQTVSTYSVTGSDGASAGDHDNINIPIGVDDGDDEAASKYFDFCNEEDYNTWK